MLRKCHGHGLTKGAIIQIFYHDLDETTQRILDETAGGIFLYKTPNQALQFLKDKVLFKLDWFIKSQNEHHQKSISFADGSNSNDDNYRLMEKLEALTIKIDSQFQTLKEEMHVMRKNMTDYRCTHHLLFNVPDLEHPPYLYSVSPTTDSPGYITESDPEDGPKEEDDEEPEEDQTDYPIDRDDDEEEEEEESSIDDVDDEEEDEGEDEEEEEENLALADSIPPP
ncbi:hypothetical protein Tco_0311702 [Tanacetum coccineum]